MLMYCLATCVFLPLLLLINNEKNYTFSVLFSVFFYLSYYILNVKKGSSCYRLFFLNVRFVTESQELFFFFSFAPFLLLLGP